MNLNEAELMALDLMEREGLTGLGDGQDWVFRFDGGLRRFGACHYRLREITLSRHLTLANDRRAVWMTITHEIAHAIAGHDAGHGPLWQRVHIAMGGDGRRCYGAEVNRVPTVTRLTLGDLGGIR